jgi:hypothetical protein
VNCKIVRNIMGLGHKLVQYNYQWKVGEWVIVVIPMRANVELYHSENKF